jgi:hypothetical protein
LPYPGSVPCRPGTPAYRLESKTRKTYCHMPYSARSCLPAREGSSAAMCPTALGPASLLRRAPTLPHVPRLWILPPCLGRLRRYHVFHGSGSCLLARGRCHVSHSSRSCLPVREGSDAVTCPTTPDPASLLERAPTLPRVPQHRTLSSCSGRL